MRYGEISSLAKHDNPVSWWEVFYVRLVVPGKSPMLPSTALPSICDKPQIHFKHRKIVAEEENVLRGLYHRYQFRRAVSLFAPLRFAAGKNYLVRHPERRPEGSPVEDPMRLDEALDVVWGFRCLSQFSSGVT